MKLILNYLSIHLKTSLEYKSSFIMGLVSQTLTILTELFTVYALFSKFKLLDTYNIYELLLGFSIVWFGYSFAQMFARGFDHFSNLIVNGDFDILLVRPSNIFIQIFGSEICYQKFVRTLTAFILFIYSASKVIINVTILKIILLILMLVGCITIMVSIFIIGASLCFVTIQGLEVINIFTSGTRQVGQYPMGIYNKIVRLIFTIIIPMTLINYYPIDYLTNRTDNILYVFMPLLTFILFLISILVFKKGMKKYCSTGS